MNNASLYNLIYVIEGKMGYIIKLFSHKFDMSKPDKSVLWWPTMQRFNYKSLVGAPGVVHNRTIDVAYQMVKMVNNEHNAGTNFS